MSQEEKEMKYTLAFHAGGKKAGLIAIPCGQQCCPYKTLYQSMILLKYVDNCAIFFEELKELPFNMCLWKCGCAERSAEGIE